MISRMLQEGGRLQKDGPSLDFTNRATEGARRSYESAIRQNGYWIAKMQSAHLLGQNPAEILARPRNASRPSRPTCCAIHSASTSRSNDTWS
jgi:zinc protease